MANLTAEDHLSRGDVRRAAEAMIEEYGPAIWRYVCAMVPDEDDARDVFQAFAEDVWRGLPGFRRESSLRTWAYRVAWSAASRFRLDAFRRRRRPLPTDAISKLAASVTSRAGLSRAGREVALARLQSTLAREDQLLLALRLDQALSWDDIAEVLAADGRPVTPAALRKRFERLKDRLKTEAKASGLVE